MRLTACGRTMRASACRRDMPMASAPSHCPRSIETMPARNTSAKKAADWIEKVTIAAMNGVISMPTISGRAKKNQNSWTSGGVVRKTSITKPAGHDARRWRDRRSKARTRPSASPQARETPVTLSVFTRPCANKGALATTGVKSH